jgi:hypothetical protein
MQIVQFFSDGTISFNWDQLPEEVQTRTDLRDKIFKELQEKVKQNEFVTTKLLYDLNKYVVNRIKSEIKKR